MKSLEEIVNSKFKLFSECDLPNKIVDLRRLLDSSPTEEEVHQFLNNNVFFLLNTPIYNHYLAVTKPKLGDEFISDFGLFGSCNGPWWTFVELEKPSDKLFSKNGDPTKALFHSIRQLKEWRAWISSNIDYFRQRFSPDSGFLSCQIPLINTMIVIDRRKHLSRNNFKLLQQFNHDHYDRIVTFDYLIDATKSLAKISSGSLVHSVAYTFQEFTTIKETKGFNSLLRPDPTLLR